MGFAAEFRHGPALLHDAEAAGFVVGVMGVDKEKKKATVLRSFSSSGPLEEYRQGVQLPKG
jgi:hypothetical protein